MAERAVGGARGEIWPIECGNKISVLAISEAPPACRSSVQLQNVVYCWVFVTLVSVWYWWRVRRPGPRVASRDSAGGPQTRSGRRGERSYRCIIVYHSQNHATRRPLGQIRMYRSTSRRDRPNRRT
ncbi:unnamed protein product [Parnassius apollo]|uniref:(apollo) hypothetical protein n=1 Tax=Parnassius apollo TaxID=110799 RepID=A0A8S3XJD1_PARAO|nr:unnamed protein product [Parnassius apollo]